VTCGFTGRGSLWGGAGDVPLPGKFRGCPPPLEKSGAQKERFLRIDKKHHKPSLFTGQKRNKE